MKIVLTGASGFIGRWLVPELAAKGASLLLVGRDPETLARTFPDQQTCSYDDLEHKAAGYDLLVHLAAINNDAQATEQDFQRVNVALLLDVAAKAKRAGIAHVINLSSIHALDSSNTSAYAASKRAAAARLQEIDGLRTTTLYLAAVYTDRWAGTLGVLNKLPKPLASAAFAFAAAVKPTLSAARLARYLLQAPPPEAGHAEDILSDGQDDNLVYKIWSRTLDLAGAALVVGLLWWLLAIVWLIVRLQSSGPGIFAQERVGRHGRHFTCYKFRTMAVGTQQAATNLVPAHAVTGIGKFLRRTKIDELPQVWNIIRNEMSFVGPRPCLPVQVELIEARRVRGVLALKPGISGLGQIQGVDMSDPVRLARLDARYGKLQSITLDLKIILATIVGKGQGDNVDTSSA